jgi:hypothetical protein
VAQGTLSSANLISQVWQNVRDLINATVTNPKGTAQWIFSAFPLNRSTANPSVYPCIIIDGAQVSSSAFVIGTVQFRTFTVPVSIYSTHMGTLDSISNSVASAIVNNPGSFTSFGYNQPSLSVSNPAHAVIADKVVHERRMELKLEGVI